jgi:hypothetical protein
MQMQIRIDSETLKSALRIDDKAAQEKINQTKIVKIEEALIVPKHQKGGLTVEEPTNRRDGVLAIYLLDEGSVTITPLAFDLKAGKFRQSEPDAEPAASASTNLQADPGRGFELALQINSRAALEAFLKYHPDGLYADLARAKLETMPS